MSDTAETIRTQQTGPILLVTVDRPAVRNAFDRATALQLEAALDRFDEDPAARVAILTGAGGVFSSGQDLKAAARGEPAVTERRGGFGIMAKPPRKPLIAAIEGAALAGGFELALSCDLIVASSISVFGLPEVKRSLVALGGGAFRLPRRLPHHLAMEMLLTGEPVPAELMKAHGVVNRVCEPGKAVETAIALALMIAGNGPMAVAATKEIAMRSLGEAWTEAASWEEQMKIASPVFSSADFREGLQAFAEKRPPVWRGV